MLVAMLALGGAASLFVTGRATSELQQSRKRVESLSAEIQQLEKQNARLRADIDSVKKVDLRRRADRARRPGDVTEGRSDLPAAAVRRRMKLSG